MAVPKVAGKPAASAELEGLLDSPEIGRLIEELQATRWTGRPGYPIRTMVGLALAKSPLRAADLDEDGCPCTRALGAATSTRLRRQPA